MPPDGQLACGPDLLDKAAADQPFDRVPGSLALEALGQEDAEPLRWAALLKMASWMSVSLVMRSSLGFSRQPALSPRQPRGGSGGERWRGGGQPQGCRSHHEQCLLCADSPALCAAAVLNSVEAGSARRPSHRKAGTVRPGRQSVRTCLQGRAVRPCGKIGLGGGERPV